MTVHMIYRCPHSAWMSGVCFPTLRVKKNTYYTKKANWRRRGSVRQEDDKFSRTCLIFSCSLGNLKKT